MDKRTFLKVTGAAGAGLVLTPWMGCAPQDPQSSSVTTTFGPDTFKLPELGFAFDALAPAMDAATMEIHHGKHHAGYVRKLNAALDGTSTSSDGRLESLLAEVSPDDTALRNNGGGHYNHTLYWEAMRPGGPNGPEGDLSELITRDLGGVEAFAAAFAKAGATQFGSGGMAWSTARASWKSPAHPTRTTVDDAMRRAGYAHPRHGRVGAWHYLNYQTVARPTSSLHERGQLGSRVVSVGGHAFAGA